MSLSFLMPTKAMRVPGVSCIGTRIYLSKLSALHTMPEDLLVEALERAGLPLGRRSTERLLDCHFHQLGGAAQAQAAQLLDHSDGLLARCGDVLASVDRLEHGRDLPHLARGHVAKDVAVPVHDTPLPGGLWKELCGALGKPDTGI